MAFTSLGVVLISTLTFVLGTFPEFQSEDERNAPPEYPEAVYAMKIIDNILVGFFVIEYVVSSFSFIHSFSLQFLTNDINHSVHSQKKVYKNHMCPQTESIRHDCFNNSKKCDCVDITTLLSYYQNLIICT